MSKHKTNTINMVDLYPFAWDTLYVFQSKGQGIIRPKKYNRFLDPYFISCPEEMDLNKTIVFTYHTKIVHKETINEYPAFDSDLIPLNFDLNHKNQIEIPRDSATFTIESYPYSEKYLGYILTYPQIIH